MKSRVLIAVLLGAIWCAPAAMAAAPSPEQSLAQLEHETARLEAVRAVKHLQRAYGFYIDRALWNEASALFAGDGRIELGADGVYVGRERVREYLLRLGGGQNGLPWGRLGDYVQLQPVVDVSADGLTARARWRDLALLGHFHSTANWGEGIYENEYVKRDGVWQIQSLHRYTTFEVPFEKGWMRAAAAAPTRSAASMALPPDRPSSVSYETFPSAFVPAFHYAPAQLAAVEDLSTVAKGDARLAPIAEQAARLADRDAVENLQAAYGYYFDRQHWDEVAALFAADGSFEYGQRGVYVGARRIRQSLLLLAPAGPKAGWLTNHLQLQPVIHVSADGRRAWGRWEGIQQLGEPNSVGAWGLGVYENEYVKVGNAWRIARLHFYQTAVADYDLMWTRGPIPAAGPSAVLPPDRPPTEVYRSLPGVYLPPYHYVHPVTGAPIKADAPSQTVTRLPPPVLTGLPPAAAALAKRLQALQDANDIEIVQKSYGYFVDKGQWTEISELFADTGTYEIGGRGVFVGKARVLEYLRTGMGTERPVEGRLINHMQFQPIVTVNADGRTGSLRMKALVVSSGGWGDVIYENTYVKDNGIWKIATIRAPFVMYTSFEGWAKSATPNTRPDSFLPPPDRLPTTVYLTYPSPHIVPFHYPNPVTGKPYP